jgi:hypothetical protein
MVDCSVLYRSNTTTLKNISRLESLVSTFLRRVQACLLLIGYIREPMATILNLCTDEIFNGQEDFVTENAGLLIGDKCVGEEAQIILFSVRRLRR